MAGLKEASIEIDFSALLESDDAGRSSFVNGGRVYFEANLFGFQTNSFTTKGFFDQLGYVEPTKPFLSHSTLSAWSDVLQWLGVIAAFLILRSTFIVCCRRGAKAQTGVKLHKD